MRKKLKNIPINELKSTELYKYLSKTDKIYCKKIEIFLNGIAPLLAKTKLYFPYFTRHDSHHGFRVCRRIFQIVKPDCLRLNKKISFNGAEVFLLIASAYAHDLGMTIFPDEEEEIRKTLDLEKGESLFNNKKIQAFLRKNHSIRGGKYISENSDKLGVPQNLVSQLNDLMRSHNLNINEFVQELSYSAAAIEKEIYIRQLSAILCIADALEFSKERAIEEVLESLANTTDEDEIKSFRENMKHKCIMDSVAISKEGVVIFSGTFKDPEVLAIAHKNIDEIEDWVQKYFEIDRNTERPKLKIIPGKFSRDLKYIGGKFERLGVRMNKDNIIKLISSNSIWKNDLGLPIKELLQNSVEACRYRGHNTKISVPYKPKITVDFNRDDHSITIIDNGCGMSQNVIIYNFLNIANSRSNQEEYCANDFKSMARFGIGFWSVFTIAENVIVSTAPFEKLETIKLDEMLNGFEFVVNGNAFKDYTLLLDVLLKPGTKIVLKLKYEIDINKIWNNLIEHILCSEIEIVLNFGSEQRILTNKISNISDEFIFGTKLHLKNELNIKTFEDFIIEDDIELRIKFIYKMQDDKISFMLDNKKALNSIIDSLGYKSRIGVCGFKFDYHQIKPCFDLSGLGKFEANISKPKGFEFTIDRQELIENETSDNYFIKITNHIHKLYTNFFKSNNSFNSESIYSLNQQSAMNHNYNEWFSVDYYWYAYKNFPDLICFKLYQIKDNIEYESIKPTYLSLAELKNIKGSIWYVQYQMESHETDLTFINGQWVSANSIKKALYNFVNSKHKDLYPNYVMEVGLHSSFLFDKNPFCVFEFNYVKQFNSFFAIQNIQTEKLNPELFKECSESFLSGYWPINILFRKFGTQSSTPFYFLDHNKYIIDINSKLATTLIKLQLEKQDFKIEHIIKLLQDKQNGFDVPQLNEYLS